MSKLKLLSSAILLSAATAILVQQTGCGGECSKASDCAAREVCYNEICQPALQPAFATSCSTDSDCDRNQDGDTLLVCEVGRCRLRDTATSTIGGGN